ncbi:MAG: FixH family protein [Anaerolineae bacterium]|jgi:hypothetical protein|nr:FixH family protein [Anaerolineae bacterium]
MSLNTAIDVAPTLDIRRPEAARRLARWAAFLCALAVLSVLCAGCGRIQQTPAAAQDGYTVTLVAQPATPVVGDGTLVVTLRDPAGQPVSGARLQVEGNMSHAGMKPSFGKIRGEDAGQYTVAIPWTMGGDWYVDIKATLSDGRVIARRFPIAVHAK